MWIFSRDNVVGELDGAPPVAALDFCQKAAASCCPTGSGASRELSRQQTVYSNPTWGACLMAFTDWILQKKWNLWMVWWIVCLLLLLVYGLCPLVLHPLPALVFICTIVIFGSSCQPVPCLRAIYNILCAQLLNCKYSHGTRPWHTLSTHLEQSWQPHSDRTRPGGTRSLN